MLYALQVYTKSERKSSETYFHESAVTEHIAKANDASDLEVANVADREKNQRLRQIKETVRIRQSPYVMYRDQVAYNLGSIYRPCLPLVTNLVVSSLSRDITRSTSQSDNGRKKFWIKGPNILFYNYLLALHGSISPISIHYNWLGFC